MITHKQAQAALKRAKGNKSAAARSIGVSRNVLRAALEREPAAKAAIKGPTPAQLQAKVDHLREQLKAERKRKVAALPKARPAKASKSIIRVVIPDSHGAHVDWKAADAMVRDIARLQPDEVVWIGDHLDCGGTFSAHQRTYTREMTETYGEDITQANALLDKVMTAAPNARHHYLEGNHEQHVDRWAARNFANYRDAKLAAEVLGPESQLRLRERGIPYYRMTDAYCGLTTPGMIKLGKCHFSHGWKASQFATGAMLRDVGGNLVHGHTHRAQMFTGSTTTSYMHAAWCPGTLAKLQPLYRHTAPSNWTHGYIVQFASVGSGNFTTFMVPIFGDKTMLLQTVDTITARSVGAVA